MKKSLWIGGGFLALLIGTLLVVPAFVDLSLFKRTYLPIVEDAIHRRVDVGGVRLSLLPTPSIHLSNLRISDTAAFPDNTFFAAKQVQLRLKLWPLIGGRFDVTEFILEKPVINLLKQPDGTFNYSDVGNQKNAPGGRYKRKTAPGRTPEAGAMPLFLPTRMRIKDGRLNLKTKGQQPVRIDDIDLSLQEFSSEHPFPYRASFSYPGLNNVSLEGELSYREDQSTLQLKNNQLKVQDLRLPVEGSVSRLSGTPRVNLRLASDHVEAENLFRVLAVFGLAPRDTEVSGPMGLQMNVTGPSNHLVTQIRGEFQGVRVDGKRALKGYLTGQVFIRLPVGGGSVARRLQGHGKLVTRDGELTNVDLIKKIQRVTGMIGLSRDERREATTFKILETEFVVGNGLADFKRIYLTNPQLEVNGGGTMTLERPTLNMAIETTLTGQASSRAGRARTATVFKDSQGRIVVPLNIAGPVENPSVNLDTGKLVGKGMNQNVEKGLGSFFQQLFRRR